MEKNRLRSILKIKNVAALPVLDEWIDWEKPTTKPFHLTSGWVAKIIFGLILSTLTLFTCQIDLVEGKEGIYDSKKRLITLRESLRLAVENSHGLMITNDMRLMAQLGLKNAKAYEKWPRIDLSLGMVYGDETDTFFSSETMKGSITISHNIFNFFQNTQEMWKSISDVTDTEIKGEQEKRNLYDAVGRAYFNLLLAQKQLKLSDLEKNRLERHLNQINILHQNGIASKFELIQAKTAFSKTKIGVELKKQNLHFAEITLAKTIGISLDERLEALEIKSEQRFSMSYEQSVEYALNHRREFIIQKKLMEKIPYYRKRIKRGKWPTLSAGMFLGDEFIYNTLDDENRIGVRLTITQPIFDAGIRDRKIQQFDIQLRVAMNTITKFKKAYLDNLKLFYVQLANSRSLVEKTKDQLDLELKIAEMVQLRYELRATTLKEMLDSQDKTKRLQDEYSKALINHMKLRFLLKIILGMKPSAEDFFG